MSHRWVVLLALFAAVLGAVAGLLVTGPGPLWRTELGQRWLQTPAAAKEPARPNGMQIAQRGDPMPALTLQKLDGNTTTLPKAYAGRPLLINLWASWCAPCIEEMPELQRFSHTQDKQRGDGVQVIGIALDDAAAVNAFLQRVPVDYPILLDAPGPADASVHLGNTRGVLPYSVLIGADGRILRQRIGPFSPGEVDKFTALDLRSP